VKLIFQSWLKLSAVISGRFWHSGIVGCNVEDWPLRILFENDGETRLALGHHLVLINGINLEAEELHDLMLRVDTLNIPRCSNDMAIDGDGSVTREFSIVGRLLEALAVDQNVPLSTCSLRLENVDLEGLCQCG
jgi:hypothetical protein